VANNNDRALRAHDTEEGKLVFRFCFSEEEKNEMKKDDGCRRKAPESNTPPFPISQFNGCRLLLSHRRPSLMA
jgi:hypothetical protein